MIPYFKIAIIPLFFFMCVIPSANADRGLRIQVKTKTGKTIPLYTDYYALVVGVGNYQNGWPKLPNPVNDAKEVAQTLKAIGFRVELLLDPLSSELKEKFNKLVAMEGKEKNRAILVYFAGHGYTREDAGGRPLGYIIPKDTVDPDKDEMGFMDKAISMRSIEDSARLIQSKHVLMVFDSCFSGALFTLVRNKPTPYIEEKVCYPVRQFITAGNEDEKVPDKSVFKDVFVQGIRDRFADCNKDGYVTGEELGFYLQEQVVNYSEGRQHPQFGRINDAKLDKGDFVFQLWPGETESSQPPAAPEGQGESGFDFSEYKHLADEHKAVRNKWDQLLLTIRANYEELLTLNKDNDVPPKIKASAWKAFLSKSGVRQNNPYSEEDDTVRKHAEELIGHWELEEERISERLKEESRKPLEKQGYISSQETGVTASDREWKDPITGMEFVYVKGGEYEMGCGDWAGDCEDDEKPAHRVKVDDFYMGKYEVTVGQWKKFIRDTGYKGDETKEWGSEGMAIPYFPQDDNHPVVCVSWYEAKAFVDWLSQKTGMKYRLPTEAEWEYAARSRGQKLKYGTKTGDISPDLANYDGKGGKDKWKNTSPVGSFPANPLGLYDMTGNVWEWCSDCYGGDYYSHSPVDNPKGPGSGTYCVVRGGSCYSCGSRSSFNPDIRYSDQGFRLSRTP